jgi:hypothetical protein
MVPLIFNGIKKKKNKCALRVMLMSNSTIWEVNKMFIMDMFGLIL